MSRADNGKLPALLRSYLPSFRLMCGVQPAEAGGQPDSGRDHHRDADPAQLLVFALAVRPMLIRIAYAVQGSREIVH